MDTTTFSSPADLSDQDLLARTMQLAADERQGTAPLIAHPTPQTRGDLLDRPQGKSKRAVEKLITGLAPQPPVPAVIRRLPAAGHHPVSPALLDGAPGGAPAPLSPPPPRRA